MLARMQLWRWSLALCPVVSPAFAQEHEPADDERNLETAVAAARWIDSLAFESDLGLAWRTALEEEPRLDVSLYSGSPGVVLFLLELARVGGDRAHLERALAGADTLLRVVADESREEPAGLYTGLAGIGATLTEVWRATGEERYEKGALACLDRILATARETESGARWNDTTDVVSGSAGIGLYLLCAARAHGRPDAVRVAQRAGDDLLSIAVERELAADSAGRPQQLEWDMGTGAATRMPNFSHGTAGVAAFLVELHRWTGVERYLEASLAGARSLASLARTQEAGGRLLPHHVPGGEDLFYLGWCHGPPGTVRLLTALAEITGSREHDRLADDLVLGLASSGIPARAPGFWENAGLCCGNAGVIDFLIARERLGAGTPRSSELRDELLEDLLARATVDELGARWPQAEHRVRPDLVRTQTGLMQGAAGIGLVLLREHLRATGGEPSVRLPDEAFDFGRYPPPATGGGR